jgi:anti-sigma B factor antagonist
MADSPSRQRLRVEQIADITVINFLDKRILDEPNIQVIADQLFSLVDDAKRRKLLCNFENVEYLSSAALGKLINLHKRLTSLQGRMALCNLIPQIMEVFTITRMDKIFKIYPDEDAGLKGLS